jgi:hypothetical protein
MTGDEERCGLELTRPHSAFRSAERRSVFKIESYRVGVWCLSPLLHEFPQLCPPKIHRVNVEL